MVLSRLTKITGPGIRTDTNWVGNNANYTGILTAASLGGIGNITATGIITASSFSGNVTAVDGTFSGNVSIAGTLTYEDVTNIDSVGIITAPALDVDDFVSVGSNIHLGNAGVVTATSFVGDGSGLIGVASTDNIITGTAATFNTYPVDINAGMTVAGVSTMAAITVTTGTFSGAIDLNADLDVDGHTNLDNVSIAGLSTHSEGIFIPDDKSIRIGNTFANPDLKIASSSSSEQVVIDYARSGSGKHLRFRCTDLMFENYNGLTKIARFQGGVGVGHAELYYAGNKKFETTVKGIQVGTGVTVETNGQATFTGIVTASTYYGDGSNLSNITSTTINNNANNRIITGSGTANTLEGESTLTYDGNYLTQTTNASGEGIKINGGNNSTALTFDANRSGANNGLGNVYGRWNGTTVAQISFNAGSDTTDKNDGYIWFGTESAASNGNVNATERLRIKSNGQIVLGSDGSNSELTFSQDGSTGVILNSTTTGFGGYNTFTVNSAQFVHKYGGNERLRIDSSGRVLIATTSGSQGQVSIFNASDFSTASVSTNTDNIFLISDATSGDGVYGASIGFSRVQYADRRAAAIATVQQGSDEDNVGLAFFTHPSSNATDPVVEALRITSAGKVGIRFKHNYTMNSQSTDLVIGDGGGGRGITLWTAAAADNQTISFQTNETLSRAEGEISYGPTATSTAADRNAMMFRTNSAERLRITSTGKVQLPTANSTNTYLNVKNIGISRISTSERLAITDIGAVAYDYELDDIMVYRSAGYWSGIDNPNRRGRIRTRNLRAAINFDIGWNYNTPYMSTITPLHSLTEGSNLSYFGNPFSDMPNTGGLDNGPYWNRSPDEANDGIVADMGTTAPTAKVSLLCWYKSDSNNSQGTGSGGSWGPQVWLFGDTRNSVSGGFGISNSKPSFHHGNNLSVTATSSPSVVDGSWHHIAYVWDGPNNDFKMYTDGTLYYTNTNLQNINSNIQFDRIGSGYNYSYTTAPQNMANVLIYDQIITDVEVKGAYYARNFYRDTLH